MSYNSQQNQKTQSILQNQQHKQSQLDKKPMELPSNQMTPPKKETQLPAQEKLQKTAQSMKLFKIQVPTNTNSQKKINIYTGCNCTKSQCLKMYCTCFADGKMCDQTCLCQACKNKTQNPARSHAIVQVINRDPYAFSKKAQDPELIESVCNCLRSGCLKKYCDCFRRGKKCGIQCKCHDCKNCQKQDSSSQDKKPRKKVKKQ